LVTRGLLNFAHRAGSVEPQPLEPGKRATMRVPLEAVAYALPPGHSLRVALSPTYWPWVWPSPDPVSLTVFTAESRLELPARSPAEESSPPAFDAPPETEGANLCECGRTLSSDSVTGRSEVVVRRERGKRRVREDGVEVGGSQTDRFSIITGDPLSAAVECDRTLTMSRGAWSTRVETRSTMTADRDSFHLVNLIEAFENDERIYSRERSVFVPRDLV
jgi:hypothetical protein